MSAAWAIKRISDFKFTVKHIKLSPSKKKNKPPLPQKMISSPSRDSMFSAKKGASAMISSGDCAKNHHQVLEIENKKEASSSVFISSGDCAKKNQKKEGCRLRPQVKYSTWDEILRKTKRIDDNDMMIIKGSSSSAVKGVDDPSAMNFSTATAKPKKTVNAVPRKSPVPVLVRRKSNHHDSDSRHMQFKANKAPIFPYKRPRDKDDDETSALNLKRRKTSLISSGVKPKPAQSPQTSCQTVVTSTCPISKKAAVDLLNDSSDASSVIHVVPPDEQQKDVVKKAVDSSTIRGTGDINSSAQEDYCGISPIIDDDTYNLAKHRVEVLTKHEDTILRHTDALKKEATKQHIRRKVIIIKGKIRAYEKKKSLEKAVENNEKRIAARIALEKVVKTVEFNDTNTECMKELDCLINVRLFDLNFAPSAVPKPLEWIGLYLFVHPDLE